MKSDELAERVFGAVLGAFETASIHLGDHLGIYRFLHEDGPATEAEVSKGCGVAPRYAREWLEQQTVAGLLEVDDPALPADARRYELPAEHVPVLVDRDSLLFSAPFARLFAAAAVQLPALAEAYRTGGGVGWSAYGDLMRTAQADANRPLFLGPLGTEILPSLDGIHARLSSGGRVADVGCGDGWSSIGIARAYPAAEVHGYDVDPASIDAARANAAEHGLDDRVTFTLVDGRELPGTHDHDLVAFFECVHDMPDPVGVLAGARGLVAPDGCVLVMDERVADTFPGAGDEVERMMYGYSILVCLPDGLSHSGSVGTGTVMRPATLASYAQQAGYSGVDVLPVEHEVFRFYRLHV